MAAGWVIGILIYMFGRTSMAFGANLQRYSMEREKKKPDDERRSKHRQPLLLTGIVLFVTSGMFLSIALVFAPQTLLSPCGVIIFVSNALFAHYLNGEEFVWAVDGTCNFFVMVGVVLCVIAAPKEETGQGDSTIKTYTSDQLIELYQTWSFVLFIVLVVVLIGGLLVTKNRILGRVSDNWSLLREDPMSLTILNLAFGVIAGTLGGFNITITKSIFQVIGGQYEEGGVVGILTSWLCYVLGFTVLFTFVFQLVAVTDGLEKCNTLVVVPCQAMTEELVATLGGLLYFQDYKEFEAWSAVVFLIGDAIAVAAVVMLVPPASPSAELAQVRIRMQRAAEQDEEVWIRSGRTLEWLGQAMLSDSEDKILIAPGADKLYHDFDSVEPGTMSPNRRCPGLAGRLTGEQEGDELGADASGPEARC